MTARTAGPVGWTLVEVLVALVVFAVLSTAASGLLIGAARLQASAATKAARVEALDPYLLVAGARIGALSACPAPSGAAEMAETASTTPVACHAGSRRCRLDAGRIVCDGGPIVRSRLRTWAGGQLGPEVEVWSVAP
ncbi:MAG: prepilin-type N-terminal cleavage/methylation domain-containing protein [Trueperaceae bacterium]|nr:prepilin-type N-terminal cleavage/methylation domain-containing protein [Trueperaceae bacterium]